VDHLAQRERSARSFAVQFAVLGAARRDRAPICWYGGLSPIVAMAEWQVPRRPVVGPVKKRADQGLDLTLVPGSPPLPSSCDADPASRARDPLWGNGRTRQGRLLGGGSDAGTLHLPIRLKQGFQGAQ